MDTSSRALLDAAECLDLAAVRNLTGVLRIDGRTAGICVDGREVLDAVAFPGAKVVTGDVALTAILNAILPRASSVRWTPLGEPPVRRSTWTTLELSEALRQMATVVASSDLGQ